MVQIHFSSLDVSFLVFEWCHNISSAADVFVRVILIGQIDENAPKNSPQNAEKIHFLHTHWVGNSIKENGPPPLTLWSCLESTNSFSAVFPPNKSASLGLKLIFIDNCQQAKPGCRLQHLLWVRPCQLGDAESTLISSNGLWRLIRTVCAGNDAAGLTATGYCVWSASVWNLQNEESLNLFYT